MKFGDLREKAREKGEVLKERGEALKEKGGEFGMDKVQRFLDEFNTTLPLLEAAGYRLVDLDIALGMPPRFAPCFQLTREVPEAEQAEHLAGLAEHKRAHMMLSTLYKTSALQAKLSVGALHAMGIVMELGAMPVTRIRYVDEKRAALTGAIGEG